MQLKSCFTRIFHNFANVSSPVPLEYTLQPTRDGETQAQANAPARGVGAWVQAMECAAGRRAAVQPLRARSSARICASTAAMAVMLTTRRDDDAGVRICAGRSRPIRIGPMATPPVATRIRL